MYRSDLDVRHKGSAVAAVAAIHAALLVALLQMSGTVDLTNTQDPLKLFEVDDVLPPPPVEPPPPPPQTREAREQPKEAEGAASAENIRSRASPIPDPEPVIKLPPPPAPAVSPTPREGTSSTQGAAPVRGPGTGAGGTGTGTGSGSGGSGTGGGGAGGIPAVRPTILRDFSDRAYPRSILESWPRGARIFARVWVEADGRPTRCDVQRSFGNAEADQWTCRLIMDQNSFRPARDSNGRPVAAWYGYSRG